MTIEIIIQKRVQENKYVLMNSYRAVEVVIVDGKDDLFRFCTLGLWFGYNSDRLAAVLVDDIDIGIGIDIVKMSSSAPRENAGVVVMDVILLSFCRSFSSCFLLLFIII